MATPEYQPQPQPESVQQVPEQPTIPEGVSSSTGVKPVNDQPQPLKQGNQMVAQPVPAPPSPAGSTTIKAHDQMEVETMAKADPSSSARWLGVSLLRQISKALKNGKQIIFGEKQ